MTAIEEKIKEFRCFHCNKLLAKAYIQSILEIKCRNCKQFSYFIVGQIFSIDKINYFKKEIDENVDGI